jgi:hypothetical protein
MIMLMKVYMINILYYAFSDQINLLFFIISLTSLNCQIYSFLCSIMLLFCKRITIFSCIIFKESYDFLSHILLSIS